jgi:regulator of protease activity HflC (stomatin/prohibitin superfamily)
MSTVLFAVFLFVAIVLFLLSFGEQDHKRKFLRLGATTALALTAFTFGFMAFTIIPASNVGIVTTFGKVHDETLAEGGHFIAPWSQVHKIYTGLDVVAADRIEAASRDLQSVHTNLTVNYHVDASKARELYQLVPSLVYEQAFVKPAMYEVFKAIVAQYTAEELVTKRQDVSTGITEALNRRIAQYYLQVQHVNLVNFGFSQAFDAAIEEKVTASQKAETAKRNLERVKFEVDARIAQAEGEAQAIAIQSAAVEKSGGAGYVQLQAIQKWDGKLPQYLTGGAAMPFINVK